LTGGSLAGIKGAVEVDANGGGEEVMIQAGGDLLAGALVC